jgi:hypothetical protein
MPFNGAGVFTRVYNWVTDRNGGIKILASRMDQEMDGFATGLSNTITRDGQSTVTQDIPFNNRKITGLANATNDADALNRITADGRYLQSIADGSVTTAKIADGAVTDAKLALQARTDVASASTTDIGAADSQYVRITGTTTITGLGTAAAGVVRDVLFGGALTLTHNATSLILPSGADITTAAGDTALFRSEGSGNWRCVRYQRADGTALLGGVDGTTTITRTGGTNSTLLVSAIAKAWANLDGTGTIALRDSQGVSSVVDEGTGDYRFNWSSAMANENYVTTMLGRGGGANYQLGGHAGGAAGTIPLTTSLRTPFGYVSSLAGAIINQDPTFAYILIHGDLA